MGHLRSRFSTHLSAKTPVLPQKIRPKSLFRNILPLTSTRSIFCADFRLSPPMFSIFYEHRGRGRGGAPLYLRPTLGNETRKADPSPALRRARDDKSKKPCSRRPKGPLFHPNCNRSC